ncbi:hypothetical protein KO465_03685 [Candidatus Micrarchaeota archaeon]|nr:hypothetical protein [Candidatus Micrarchaeota archaeon]
MEPFIQQALDNAQNDEEKLSVVTYYYNLYTQKTKHLQDQIRMIEAQIDELSTALGAVKDIEKNPSINFNIGGGIYVPGKPVKGDVFIDIGSYYVSKTQPEEAVKITSERLEFQIETLKNLTEEFSKGVETVSKLNSIGQSLLAKNVDGKE